MLGTALGLLKTHCDSRGMTLRGSQGIGLRVYIPAEPGVENFLDHRNVSRKSSGSWNLVNFQEFG